jgi:hypothetical protein
MKRVVLSALVGLLVPALFWLGGYDFDQRGSGAVMCAVYTLLVGGMAYMFPGWDDR